MTGKKLDEKKTVKYSQFVHDMFKKVQQFSKELNEEDVKEDDGNFRQVGTFTIRD